MLERVSADHRSLVIDEGEVSPDKGVTTFNPLEPNVSSPILEADEQNFSGSDDMIREHSGFSHTSSESIGQSGLIEGSEVPPFSDRAVNSIDHSFHFFYCVVRDASTDYQNDFLVALGAFARVFASSYQAYIIAKLDNDAAQAAFELMALQRIVSSLLEGILWSNSIILAKHVSQDNKPLTDQYLKVGINLCVTSSLLCGAFLLLSKQLCLFHDEQVKGEHGYDAYSTSEAAENYLLAYAPGLPFYFLATFVKHIAIVYRSPIYWATTDVAYSAFTSMGILLIDKEVNHDPENGFLFLGLNQSVSSALLCVVLWAILRNDESAWPEIWKAFKEYAASLPRSFSFRPTVDKFKSTYFPIMLYTFSMSIFWLVWTYVDRRYQADASDQHLSEMFQPAYQVMYSWSFVLEAMAFSSTVGVHFNLSKIIPGLASGKVEEIRGASLLTLKHHASSLCIATLSTGFAVWSFREHLAHLFTNSQDEEVLAKAADLLKIVALILGVRSASSFCNDNLRAFDDVVWGPVGTFLLLALATVASAIASAFYDQHLSVSLEILFFGLLLSAIYSGLRLVCVSDPKEDSSALEFSALEYWRTKINGRFNFFVEAASHDNSADDRSIITSYHSDQISLHGNRNQNGFDSSEGRYVVLAP